MSKWSYTIKDSGSQEDPKKHMLYAPMYEPIWQGIRLSLSFKTYDSIRRAIGLCKAYIMRADDANEYVLRLLRVRNVFIALPVYSPHVTANQAELVQSYAQEVNELLEETDYKFVWDWDTARTQARHAYIHQRAMFDQMYRDLRDRARKKGKKTELRYFLSILDEVINEHS